MSLPPTCPSCGHPRPERYCGRCGERAVEANDLTLGRFFHALGSELVPGIESEEDQAVGRAGGRVFRTVYAMFRWPGRLTADYIAGRRRPYLKPIQVYLTIAVIFFVFSGNFFQYELGEYEYVPVIGETADLLESEMKRRGETADVYEDVFNARLDSQKKTMFALLVPLFALALIPFYHRRMIGEHMIYSIHVQGALLLFMIGPVKLLFLAVASIVRLIAAIAPSLGPGLSGVFDNEMSVILLIYVPFLIYNFIALRVVYGGRRVVTGAVAIALFIWHIILVVFVFRLGLFFTTFYSLKWFG